MQGRGRPDRSCTVPASAAGSTCVHVASAAKRVEHRLRDVDRRPELDGDIGSPFQIERARDAEEEQADAGLGMRVPVPRAFEQYLDAHRRDLLATDRQLEFAGDRGA